MIGWVRRRGWFCGVVRRCTGALVLGALGALPRSPALGGTELAAAPTDVTILAAGDIGQCGSDGPALTGRLLDQFNGTVLALGDLAYPDGTTADFTRCYEPGWGRHKARTLPVPGNHDYNTRHAAGYFAYWGARAHPPGGYYSLDLGHWHLVALNSNISLDAGSPQESWLRSDLAATAKACKLVFLHHPGFSSGWHGHTEELKPAMGDFYRYGVTLVLSGHDHHYERFAPVTDAGLPDPAHGTRYFVVGTGGARLHPALFTSSPSEASNSAEWGLLRLTLHERSYNWEWVPAAAGAFHDKGQGACVTPPAR